MNDIAFTIPAELESLLEKLHAARAEISSIVVGQDQVVEQMLIGLMAGGHVLLEGPPGAGKTLLVKTLADVTGLSFSRVQFTPDLMPGDITGSLVLTPDETGRNVLEFQRGPIFTQLLLADEINRATPRTQSALLEAMQEHTVSAAGKSMKLPSPFFVLATQNPIEMEGTYVLPEAQIDRFMFRIDVPYPRIDTLTEILRMTTGEAMPRARALLRPDDILALQALVRTVPAAEHVRRAVATLAAATQPTGADEQTRRHIQFGLSPRATQAMVLAAKANALMAGRFNVACEDLEAVLLPIVRHRIHLSYQAGADGISIDQLAETLFDRYVRRAL